MTALEIEMFNLLKKLNYAFYVDGSAKTMRPLMAQTKPLLDKVRDEYGTDAK